MFKRVNVIFYSMSLITFVVTFPDTGSVTLTDTVPSDWSDEDTVGAFVDKHTASQIWSGSVYDEHIHLRIKKKSIIGL